MKIGNHEIGASNPVYVIAELSANHNHSYESAVRLIEAAWEAGADAVKIQTYTPDTMTIAHDSEYFRIKGTLWEGRNLHDLYAEAQTPWEWHAPLQAEARRRGLDFFSTPFDATAVDFLEKLDVPAYKIASFEIVDLPLIRLAAATGKPLIISTGMASLGEIEEAVNAARGAGARQFALLKCTSAYPASPQEMNLRTIPHLAQAFGGPIGLSDHTLGTEVPIAAVALGASIIEKHLTMARSDGGPDAAFSLEPHEFKTMVQAVRTAQQALGEVRYQTSASEQSTQVFRRSLFVVQDIPAGELFTADNVRSIRPANGLAPKYLEAVLGRPAKTDIPRGTPLRWELVG